MTKKEPLRASQIEAQRTRFMQTIADIHRIAETSKQVVDFTEGFILIDPEMKRMKYLGSDAESEQLYRRGLVFEQLCAQACVERMFNKQLFPDAQDPVDLFFSIGSSGIPYGNTFVQVYRSWMESHHPGVEVAYVQIQKIEGDVADSLVDVNPDGSLSVNGMPIAEEHIQSFTQKHKVPFGIPLLTDSMLKHPNISLSDEQRSMFWANGKRRCGIIDDVFAHGFATQGICDAITKHNKSLKPAVAVAMMSKLFQGGEHHIREATGMKTFAPLRYSDVDESRKTYLLGPQAQTLHITGK